MRNWLSRQSFLGAGSDALLAELRVAILGLGGGGSHIAQQCAHVGVGHFQLVDDDAIEDTNLNRVVGATAIDVKEATAKVTIASRRILEINPNCNVESIKKKWQTVSATLRPAHVVFGCVDSFKAREEIEIFCRRYHIPYIDIGMDVNQISGTKEFSMSGQLTISLPGGPCLRCLNFLTDELIAKEVQTYGAAGPRPQVVWANGTLASSAVGALIAVLTAWSNEDVCPYLEYDGNSGMLTKSRKLEYIGECDHFDNFVDIGDPFFE